MGTGKCLLPGITLFLGGGGKQLSGSNLGSGTSEEGTGPCIGAGSPGDFLHSYLSLVGSSVLPGGS